MSPFELIVLIFVFVLSVFSVYRWRAGVLVTILLGLLLDPLRKLIPGEPVYMSGVILLPMVATLVGALNAGVTLPSRNRKSLNAGLLSGASIFLLLVLVQSFHAMLRTGSIVIAIIGMLAYLSPLPGFVIGFAYPQGTNDIKRVFKWYTVVVCVMALGIYLVKMGYHATVLEPVGKGLYVYGFGATRLESGFFRAPEVAAWHLGAASVFISILAFTRLRSSTVQFLILGCIPFLLGALVYTGRRKGLAVVFFFFLFYFAFTVFFRHRTARTAIVVIALVGVILGAMFFTDLGHVVDVRPYLSRGGNLSGGMGMERVEKSLTDAIRWTIARNGFFGMGAGTGSQGSQYFGGGSAIVGSAAEGGLGKIVAELGVPGLVLLVWMALAGLVQSWATMKRATQRGRRHARYAYGLVGFLLGNAMIFVIGHQIFGDPFVLFLLGFSGGLLLAIPRIIDGSVRLEKGAFPPPHRRVVRDVSRTGLEMNA